MLTKERLTRQDRECMAMDFQEHFGESEITRIVTMTRKYGVLCDGIMWSDGKKG